MVEFSDDASQRGGDNARPPKRRDSGLLSTATSPFATQPESGRRKSNMQRESRLARTSVIAETSAVRDGGKQQPARRRASARQRPCGDDQSVVLPTLLLSLLTFILVHLSVLAQGIRLVRKHLSAPLLLLRYTFLVLTKLSTVSFMTTLAHANLTQRLTVAEQAGGDLAY